MNPRKILKSTLINKFFYLWVIFLFSVATFLFDTKLALTEMAIFSILLVIYIISGLWRRNQILDYFEELTLTMDTASKESLMNFPLPVVVLKKEGNISWYNELFLRLISDSDNHYDIGFEMPVTDFIPDIDIKSIISNTKNNVPVSEKVKHKDVIYNVFGTVTNSEHDDSIIILYFADITKVENLKSMYENEKFVSGVILIDNYDDIVQNTPSSERPLLFAAYDNIFDKIAESTGGIVKKLEKDRYLFYFRKQYLNEFSENKFEILNQFKTVSDNPNRIPTFSIGIGSGGDSMAKNDSMSYEALDMAISRGGDQIAIKTPERYRFIGGTSKEILKRTRIRARVIANSLSDLISNAQNVIIMGHKNADMDVVGAALGLSRIITNAGKEVKILMESCNQTVSNFKSSLSNEYIDLFINSKYAAEIVGKNTLVIVVDTHVSSMLDNPDILNECKQYVIIDHHRKNPDFISDAVLTYHEPYASSASELVTELIQYLDNSIQLPLTEANAMYAGIYLDTKNFSFKTNTGTFDAASFLKKHGADQIKVKKMFQLDRETLTKIWTIVSQAKEYKHKIYIANCEKNDPDMRTVVASAADEILNIKGVSASFVVCDMGDSYFISARSLGDINVQTIMEKMGGGGHITVAATFIKKENILECMNTLYECIDSVLN